MVHPSAAPFRRLDKRADTFPREDAGEGSACGWARGPLSAPFRHVPLALPPPEAGGRLLMSRCHGTRAAFRCARGHNPFSALRGKWACVPGGSLATRKRVMSILPSPATRRGKGCMWAVHARDLHREQPGTMRLTISAPPLRRREAQRRLRRPPTPCKQRRPGFVPRRCPALKRAFGAPLRRRS